jgi:hypothetical protein
MASDGAAEAAAAQEIDAARAGCDMGGVLRVMRAHVSCAATQTRACTALRFFNLLDPRHAAAAVQAGVFGDVAAAMRAFPADAVLQKSALTTLCELLPGGELETLRHAAVARVAEAVCTALRTHGSDTFVLGKCCPALRALVTSPECAAQAEEAGAAALLLGVLRPDTCPVHSSCSAALPSILRAATPERRAALVADGAFDVFCSVFGRRTFASIDMNVCSALLLLLEGGAPERVDAARAAGALQSVLTMLHFRASIDDESEWSASTDESVLAACACRALVQLTAHDAEVNVFVCEAVLTAVCAHTKDARAQTSLLETMRDLNRRPDIGRCFLDGFALEEIAAAMKEHAADVALMRQACETLAGIAPYALSCGSVAAEATVVPALCAALASPDDVVQARACYGLTSFACSVPAAAAAGALGVVESLISLLRTCPALVLQPCLRALSTLMRFSTANTAAALRAGVTNAVAAVMRAHPNEADVQADACEALAALLCVVAGPDISRQAVDDCVIGLVHFAMLTHADSRRVLHYGCAVLAALACGDGGVMPGLSLGAFLLCLETMQTRICDAALQHDIINTLTERVSCASEAGCVPLVAAGAFEVVCDSMHAHSSDAALQRAGVALLRALLERTPERRQSHAITALDAGIVNALVEASVMFDGRAAADEDLAMQSNAWRALELLAPWFDAEHEYVWQAVCDCMMECLEGDTGSAAIQQDGLCVLLAFCEAREMLDCVITASVVRTVAAVMRAHADIAELQEAACGVLQHLTLRITPTDADAAAPAILAVLRARTGADAVAFYDAQRSACTMLLVWLQQHAAVPARVAALGTLDTLVALLRAPGDEVQVRRWVVMALSFMASRSSDYMDAALRAGAYPAAAELLLKFKFYPDDAGCDFRTSTRNLFALLAARQQQLATQAADAAMAALLAEEEAERAAKAAPPARKASRRKGKPMRSADGGAAAFGDAAGASGSSNADALDGAAPSDAAIPADLQPAAAVATPHVHDEAADASAEGTRDGSSTHELSGAELDAMQGLSAALSRGNFAFVIATMRTHFASELFQMHACYALRTLDDDLDARRLRRECWRLWATRCFRTALRCSSQAVSLWPICRSTLWRRRHTRRRRPSAKWCAPRCARMRMMKASVPVHVMR